MFELIARPTKGEIKKYASEMHQQRSNKWLYGHSCTYLQVANNK